MDLAQGARALVSMCWDHQAHMQVDGESPGQCGTLGAAEMARRAGVDKLVLVHRGPGLEGDQSEAQALADMKSIFAGEVILADELDVIDL